MHRRRGLSDGTQPREAGWIAGLDMVGQTFARSDADRPPVYFLARSEPCFRAGRQPRRYQLSRRTSGTRIRRRDDWGRGTRWNNHEFIRKLCAGRERSKQHQRFDSRCMAEHQATSEAGMEWKLSSPLRM